MHRASSGGSTRVCSIRLGSADCVACPIGVRPTQRPGSGSRGMSTKRSCIVRSRVHPASIPARSHRVGATTAAFRGCSIQRARRLAGRLSSFRSIDRDPDLRQPYPVDRVGQHRLHLLIGAVFVFCILHAFDPPRLNWGDSGSDFNAMSAGRNFQKYGFLKLRLTPFLLDPAVMTIDHDKMFIYTHYPQLPDLMNGLLRVVFRNERSRPISLRRARLLVRIIVLRLRPRPSLLVTANGTNQHRIVGHEPVVGSARRLSASHPLRGVLRVRQPLLPAALFRERASVEFPRDRRDLRLLRSHGLV